jgi:putative flippase GtrA
VSAGHHLPRLAVVPQLSRYVIVSMMALTLDFAVFLGFNAAFGLPTLAGVIGYSCGIVLHYFLSRNFVFNAMRSRKSAHRLFSEFVASGLIGLTATAGVIAFATAYLGFSAIVAKILAVAASFVGVFLIRRTIVFA